MSDKSNTGTSPDKTALQWFISCISGKFADFSGRARRREYWSFALFAFLAGFVLGFVPYVGYLAIPALLVPGFAVGARRLHDVGRSGWLQLIAVIPVLGFLVLAVLMAKEGDAGVNSYGPNPKN